MQRRFLNASLKDGRVSVASALGLLQETAELLCHRFCQHHDPHLHDTSGLSPFAILAVATEIARLTHLM
jgi:hypothetical protein